MVTEAVLVVVVTILMISVVTMRLMMMTNNCVGERKMNAKRRENMVGVLSKRRILM